MQPTKQLTRDQVNIIIKNGQDRGLKGREVLDGLVSRGYQVEGLEVGTPEEQNLSAFDEHRNQVEKFQENKLTGTLLGPASEGFRGLKTLYGGGPEGIAMKLKDDVMAGADDIQKGMEENNPFYAAKGIAKSGLRTAADVGGTVYAPISAVVGATGIGKVFNKVGELSQKGGNFNPLNWLTNNPEVQKWATNHPNAAEDFGRALTLAFASQDSRPIEPSTMVPRTINQIQAVGNKISSAVGGVENSVKEMSTYAADQVSGAPDKGINALRTKMGSKQVQPNLKTSVGRLKTNKIDPLKEYDRFVQQEKAFKGDIKQGSSLEKVGEETGKAFDKVVKQRQTYGKTMAKELEKVKNVKTDITKPKTNFETEVKSQGLKIKNGELVQGKASKITSQDQGLLNQYNKDLAKLGPNPSVKELDAFISKTSQDLKVYKSTNNILSTTNGERIVKVNLDNLRDQLSPQATGNPALKPYYEAKQSYSKLSSFLDEGIKYLGKKTSTGDYVKDASLLKSSVNSIISGGKKDWLAQLEKLTGEPVLDKTVLALQAMKDSGNQSGMTLSQQIVGKVPTSPSDIVTRLIDFAYTKGLRALGGSPVEQTRAFLNSLDKPQTVAPTSNTGGIPNKQGGFVSVNAPDLSKKFSSLERTAAKYGAREGSYSSSNPNSVAAGQIENSKLLNNGMGKYPGSAQQLIDTNGGWIEGVQTMFDSALRNGDKFTIKALLQQNAVPEYYLNSQVVQDALRNLKI